MLRVWSSPKSQKWTLHGKWMILPAMSYRKTFTRRTLHSHDAAVDQFFILCNSLKSVCNYILDMICWLGEMQMIVFLTSVTGGTEGICDVPAPYAACVIAQWVVLTFSRIKWMLTLGIDSDEHGEGVGRVCSRLWWKLFPMKERWAYSACNEVTIQLLREWNNSPEFTKLPSIL